MNKKEIHKIAPILSEISHLGAGFDVPKNYFAALEEKLVSEMNIQSFQKKSKKNNFQVPPTYFDEIEKKVISKLKVESFGKNANKKMPENYFDTLEDRITQRIDNRTKVISLKSRLLKVVFPLTIAASLLLIFTLSNNSKSVTFDSIATNDIQNWIDEGNLELDAYNLATIYNDIELDESYFGASISDNELQEYLDLDTIEQLILEN